MTIYEIKRRLEGNPHYFSRETLKCFGQTLKDFSVRKFEDKFLISAPIRKWGRVIGRSERLFNPETNRLEHLPRE
jgi:hypothetical protein